MSTSDPIETLHKIRTGYYSIITFLDMLEMLDVQATIREDESDRTKAQERAKNKKA